MADTAFEKLLPVMEPIMKSKRECMFVLFLDGRRRLIGEPYCLSIGIMDAALVHPRELFKEAILRSAGSVLIAHNHPSGILDPSVEDYQLTRRLIEAGEILGIELVDHLIMGFDNCVSLRASGVRWKRSR